MNFYLTCIKYNSVSDPDDDSKMHYRPGDVISVTSIVKTLQTTGQIRPSLYITTVSDAVFIMSQDSFRNDYIYTIENRDDI
jgi:hypothetical protein